VSVQSQTIDDAIACALSPPPERHRDDAHLVVLPPPCPMDVQPGARPSSASGTGDI
jgi:hypothetical protein